MNINGEDKKVLQQQKNMPMNNVRKPVKITLSRRQTLYKINLKYLEL
jgi:hypothetical protein